MTNTPAITRRQFFKKATITAAAVSFPYVVRSSALGKAGSVAPSNRIVMGCIGTGKQGQYVMGNFLQQPRAQLVAICDCRKSQRGDALAIIKEHTGKADCASYNDFRELCARTDIDAVLIASTDHWHVLHALEAARTGKDMYLEKPIGMSVQQAQVLRKAIKRYGRVFQFGTQQRSDRNFRFACELALNGRIGKLHTIKVAVPPSIKTGHYPIVAVPPGLDYEMWLGPAPWAPYMEERIVTLGPDWHKLWWHISDYSLGWISAWGIHHIDIAQWGNGTELTGPVEVEGTGVFPDEGLCDCATSWNVKAKYANGVTLDFTDNNQNPQGVRFEGADGWVFVKRGAIDAHPKSLLTEEIGPDQIHLPLSNHHQQNFLDCVKSRGRPVSPIESAVCSEIVCQLADIATRTKRKLTWDAEKEKFTNDEQANTMLKRTMRTPWHL
ncbi:MAG: Gfo/Idh/MocA family protein [Planctomycetota bacterium]